MFTGATASEFFETSGAKAKRDVYLFVQVGGTKKRVSKKKKQAGVSMTPKKWLVITQNNGVLDSFLKGHGDSQEPKRKQNKSAPVFKWVPNVGLPPVNGSGCLWPAARRPLRRRLAGPRNLNRRLLAAQGMRACTWGIPLTENRCTWGNSLSGNHQLDGFCWGHSNSSPEQQQDWNRLDRVSRKRFGSR